MRNWIKNLFSLEERRVSSIMLSFIAFSGVGVYLLIKTHDISLNLSYIIMTLAGMISGVNIIPNIMSGIKQNNINNKDNNQDFNDDFPVNPNSNKNP